MHALSEHRSVLSYEKEEDIFRALQDKSVNDENSRPDWVLPINDAVSFEKQSLAAEADRLNVLREYRVLETENENEFDTITAEAGEFYNVPWACVSFVDMGRLWFKSMYKDDIQIKETSRKDSFCTYALQSKEDIFVIRDTHQDERFVKNPYVTGHPGWRFYAGVPLVSPEGPKLGTFCLLDRKPRPNGLTVEDERKLKTMAKNVMDRLVQRRRKCALGSKRPSEECLAKAGQVAEKAETPAFIEGSSDEELSTAKKSKLNPSGTPKTTEPVRTSAAATAIIRPPVLNAILPNPNTAGVDPDAYLAQLVEALYGVKLQTKAALSLKGFFAKVTDDQMAAYDMAVVTAARENNIEGLRKICAEKGPKALDCFNRFGEGLLNLSCRRGFKEITAYLLSDEVGLKACVRDDYGRTPLHDACWNPSPLIEICTWLLQKEPALFFITDKRGFTPFQYARKSDWLVWRQFLFDRRHLFESLARPEIQEMFS